jgi:hypothetical protein
MPGSFIFAPLFAKGELTETGGNGAGKTVDSKEKEH